MKKSFLVAQNNGDSIKEEIVKIERYKQSKKKQDIYITTIMNLNIEALEKVAELVLNKNIRIYIAGCYFDNLFKDCNILQKGIGFNLYMGIRCTVVLDKIKGEIQEWIDDLIEYAENTKQVDRVNRFKQINPSDYTWIREIKTKDDVKEILKFETLLI